MVRTIVLSIGYNRPLGLWLYVTYHFKFQANIQGVRVFDTFAEQNNNRSE